VSAACVANDTTVCLLNQRFSVTVDYVNPFSDPPNQPGTFRAMRLLEGLQNPDTALFGFSNAQAVEVVVRIQDTRPFAPRFDVYYGGMSDVGYTVTVTDTQTGTTRQYTNTVGRVGGGVDRTSFSASGTGGGGANCSETEPNNTVWDPDVLTSGVPCTGGAAKNDAYEYAIEWEDDLPGRILDVTLTFTNPGADLDVVLFDEVGPGQVVIYDQSTTTSMTEHFTSAMYGAGTFYIGVSAYEGGSPYTLTVTAQSATAPAAPTNLQATAISATEIRLTWTDNSTDESSFVVQRKQGPSWVDYEGPPAAPNTTEMVIPYLEPGTTATYRIRARNAGGFSAPSNEATATTFGETGCTADATTVCLLSGRFRVKIDYVNPFSNPPNQPGTFLAARLLQGVQNPDTALFGFSSAQAVEVVVRIQDTRPFAPRFDVYYGGMTDVGYVVTVTDTQTGTTRQYTNTVGTVGGGVDRTTFPAN
jgi:acid phosphatase family membrane protein YuiD